MFPQGTMHCASTHHPIVQFQGEPNMARNWTKGALVFAAALIFGNV